MTTFTQFQTWNGRGILGDCFEVMSTLEDQSVDMVLADLPYGTTQNKWDSVLPMDSLWDAYKRVCKGAIVLTASQPFTSTGVASNSNDFQYSWVWEKNNATGHLNAKRMPMKIHEDVVVFRSKEYFPQDLVPYNKKTRRGGNGGNFGKSGTENFQEFTNYPRSVLYFPSDTKRFHETQKPVALFEYLIKTYSKEGDLVLDNTAGSMTTGVACENTGRQWICIEKDSTYFEKAKARFGNAVFGSAS